MLTSHTQIGFDHLTTRPYFCRAARSEYPAEIEDGNTGTKAHHKRHIVLDQKDSHTFPEKGSQEIRHYRRLPLTHAGHRFIEK
jgi:hypothetical protein